MAVGCDTIVFAILLFTNVCVVAILLASVRLGLDEGRACLICVLPIRVIRSYIDSPGQNLTVCLVYLKVSNSAILPE
jgi:hypothetical protein